MKITKKSLFYYFKQFPENFHILWLEEKKRKKSKSQKKFTCFTILINSYPENSYIPSSDNSPHSLQATNTNFVKNVTEHLNKTKMCPNCTMNIFNQHYDDMSTCKGTPCIKRGAEACQAMR